MQNSIVVISFYAFSLFYFPPLMNLYSVEDASCLLKPVKKIVFWKLQLIHIIAKIFLPDRIGI